MRILSALVLVCLLGCENQKDDPIGQDEFVLALGSCNRTDLSQDIWEAVNANEPDVFVWLGDIVYGDTHDMDQLREKYDRLKTEPGYEKVLAGSEVIGVWDDHDYGWNDGGKYFSKKAESKEVLLDFLDVAPDDPLRTYEGMYSARDYLDGKVNVILLDARSFRDTLVHDPDPDRRYTSNPDGNILGDAQWQWLEDQLRNSQADINIIGCGIQFIPEEHGWEKWANFPKSRKRLFDLLEETRPSGVILISGDRHIAEISRITLDDMEVIELTSSGLTHTWSEMWEEANQYRLGDKIVKRNFGIIRILDASDSWKVKLEVRGLGDSLFKVHPITIKK